MRNWPRTLGVTAALIALVGVAGWLVRPDLHDRVRLMSPGTVPWIRAGDQVSAAGVTGVAAPSATPCTQADLDAWQMPMPPDAASHHATLYCDHFGTKRVEQGQTLVSGVIVDSITPTQVTLVCAGGAVNHISHQLTMAPPVAPNASSAGQSAPLGN